MQLKNLSLRTKLLGLAAAGLLPLPAMLWLVSGLVHQTSSLAGDSCSDISREACDHLLDGVYGLCSTQQESLTARLDIGLKIARHELAQAGGFRLDATKKSEWPQKAGASPLKLPTALLGTTPLLANAERGIPSPIVDPVTQMAGVTCTLFQRVNPEGDMMRVCTSVMGVDGRRAIGTQLRVRNDDGQPNPVLAAVLSGSTYRGRANVVGNWYLTAYEPLKDESGQVIGILYAGVPQDGLTGLQQSVQRVEFGQTGSAFIIDSAGNMVVDSARSNGMHGDKESLIRRAKSLAPGQALDVREGGYFVRCRYFEAWDWVIAIQITEAELLSAAERVTELGKSASWKILGLGILGGVVILLLGLSFSSLITKPIRAMADILHAVAQGDLSKEARVDSQDELGQMSQAMNRAISELRQARRQQELFVEQQHQLSAQQQRQAELEQERSQAQLRAQQERAELERAEREREKKLHEEKAERERQQQELARSEAEELQRRVDTLLIVVDSAMRGDLTQSVPALGNDPIGKMGTGLDKFFTDLRVSISSIAQNARTLSASSEELSAASSQMSANAEETSSQANAVSAASEQVSRNVQVVAAGVEEMSASIREIAKNASDAARVAGTAVRAAESANSTIGKLGESSSEIGKVVKVITSIAEQTNLLALNATIEAARAGEAGKGFAVVANEVKELAKETARATEDIGSKIEAIQADTSAAVTAINQISQVINQINDISSTIASAVEEQTATTNEISRGVGEAAKGSSEIAQNITSVAQAALSTNEGASNALRACEELAHMATELQQLVSRFQYEEGQKSSANGRVAGGVRNGSAPSKNRLPTDGSRRTLQRT